MQLLHRHLGLQTGNVALIIKQADIMSAASDSPRRAFVDKLEWCSFAKHESFGPVSMYWLPKPPWGLDQGSPRSLEVSGGGDPCDSVSGVIN